MQRIITIITLLGLLSGAGAQQKKSVVIPGKGHLDIEKFNKSIDLNMDISNLSLSELRILRNGISARQGYLFMNADLRSIYSRTSWYDSIMYERSEGTSQPPIRYSKAEIAFMKRLKAREDELKKKNFATAPGQRVNIDNLVNSFQLERMDAALKDALGKNGFAIVPNRYEQLFHAYENNDYHDFPNFVTTDLYLQLFHLYFDCLLRDIERSRFTPLLQRFCHDMYVQMQSMLADKNAETRNAAAYNAAYFAIAEALIGGQLPKDISPAYAPLAETELQNIEQAENSFSDFLEYHHATFNYSLFRPRGHYTRNDTLQRYFRAMMWLQTVPFGTDKPHQLRRAALIGHTIGTHPALLKSYRMLFDPMTYLMGTPDNVTILQLDSIMKSQQLTLGNIMKSNSKLNELRRQAERLAEHQTRIKPYFKYSSEYKLNLMPQRYMPDAEVLQTLVDYRNTPARRSLPTGLDVLAALGNTAAEQILLSDLNEDQRWGQYRPLLTKMKQRMSCIDWQQTIANRWIASLTTLSEVPDAAPYFMKTPQWQKKCLNTALASWAELKHDAILYAKQPEPAECGAGGPPPPILKSYVEPNIAFWTKAVALIRATVDVLKQYDLLTDQILSNSERVEEQAEFLRGICQKELEGKKISDEEYAQLECIGASYENLSLQLMAEPDSYLNNWDDVQDEDRKVALVADVFTQNADNVPQQHHAILYQAVGNAYNIYVVVELDGYLYLMRGAVLSYREFAKPSSEPRLTDKEWQQQLETDPTAGTPAWMDEITVPLEELPQDNERFFYSSGC